MVCDRVGPGRRARLKLTTNDRQEYVTTRPAFSESHDDSVASTSTSSSINIMSYSCRLLSHRKTVAGAVEVCPLMFSVLERSESGGWWMVAGCDRG